MSATSRPCAGCGRPLSPKTKRPLCQSCYRGLPLCRKAPLYSQPPAVIVEVLRELVETLVPEALGDVLLRAIPPEDLPRGYVSTALTLGRPWGSPDPPSPTGEGGPHEARPRCAAPVAPRRPGIFPPDPRPPGPAPTEQRTAGAAGKR